jgi:hypothetical protein
MPLCRVPNKGEELVPEDPNIDPLDFPLIFLHLSKGVGCHSQTYIFTVREFFKINQFIQGRKNIVRRFRGRRQNYRRAGTRLRKN